jgi:hypothetical protein
MARSRYEKVRALAMPVADFKLLMADNLDTDGSLRVF